MLQSFDTWAEWLKAGLKDDDWQWDWTTRGTLGKQTQKIIQAQVVAKAEGVFAGAPLQGAVEAVSASMGMTIQVRNRVADGAAVKRGTVVAEWKGPAQSVLALERPYLNLASYVSGIATQTNRLVQEVQEGWAVGSRGTKGLQPPRVTSTRKTLPGYRELALHGVLAGGGYSHRVSLSGGVLIKENHIAAAGGIRASVEGARAIAPHGLKIEIEVRNSKELSQALSAKADVIMLDNFSPEQVHAAVEQVSKALYEPMIEVSGGLNAGTIGAYAIPGVHILSVGSITHSVAALDLSMLVKR